MRVLEPGGEPDLALKALGAEGSGELGMQQLEGDGAIVLEVLGQPDRGHASAPELAIERVPIPQPVAECCYRISHASRGGSKPSGIEKVYAR